MKTSQVVASLIFVGWLAYYWLIGFNWGFMTGFGPSGPGDPYSPAAINWNQIRVDLALSVVWLIPILALWTHSSILIAIGFVMLSPIAIVGVFLLLTVPLPGLAILATVCAWYYAAISQISILDKDEATNGE